MRIPDTSGRVVRAKAGDSEIAGTISRTPMDNSKTSVDQLPTLSTTGCWDPSGQWNALDLMKLCHVIEGRSIQPCVPLHLPPEGHDVDQREFELNHPLSPRGCRAISSFSTFLWTRIRRSNERAAPAGAKIRKKPVTRKTCHRHALWRGSLCWKTRPEKQLRC